MLYQMQSKTWIVLDSPQPSPDPYSTDQCHASEDPHSTDHTQPSSDRQSDSESQPSPEPQPTNVEVLGICYDLPSHWPYKLVSPTSILVWFSYAIITAFTIQQFFISLTLSSSPQMLCKLLKIGANIQVLK